MYNKIDIEVEGFTKRIILPSSETGVIDEETVNELSSFFQAISNCNETKTIEVSGNSEAIKNLILSIHNCKKNIVSETAIKI